MHTIALEEYSNGQGALINGRVDGHFLEDPSLFSVLERAAAHGMPPYPKPLACQPTTVTVSPATV
jgi:hypothetical protein